MGIIRVMTVFCNILPMSSFLFINFRSQLSWSDPNCQVLGAIWHLSAVLWHFWWAVLSLPNTCERQVSVRYLGRDLYRSWESLSLVLSFLAFYYHYPLAVVSLNFLVLKNCNFSNRDYVLLHGEDWYTIKAEKHKKWRTSLCLVFLSNIEALTFLPNLCVDSQMPSNNSILWSVQGL